MQKYTREQRQQQKLQFNQMALSVELLGGAKLEFMGLPSLLEPIIVKSRQWSLQKLVVIPGVIALALLVNKKKP